MYWLVSYIRMYLCSIGIIIEVMNSVLLNVFWEKQIEHMGKIGM